MRFSANFRFFRQPRRLMPMVILALAALSAIYAQPWNAQPSGTTNRLEAVWFTSPTKGFAVGNAGTALRTSDGGASWTPFPVSSQDLEDIAFIGNSIGLIVGDNELIFQSTDGGASWSQVHGGGRSTLRAVAMGENGRAYVAGDDGLIMFSTDDGATWTTVGSGTNRYEGAWAWGDAFGWIVGRNGIIMATTDGGATWNPQTSGTSSDLKNVFFASHLLGWAVGQNSTVIKTADGGASWLPSNSGVGFGMDGVYFTSPSEGWIVGDNGAVYHTTNSGANWQIESSGTTNELNDVHFYGPASGWAVGDMGTIVSRQGTGIKESSLMPVPSAGAVAWPSPAVRSSSVRLTAELPGPRVTVVAADGRVIRELEPAGEDNLFRWDLRDYYRQLVVPGVYFYRIASGSLETSLPVIVVRD